MWELIRELSASGVTVILTTHYIEEAEEMAGRIGVINKGELILVEKKDELIRKLGQKQLTLDLQHKVDALPPELSAHNLTLISDGHQLVYTYNSHAERTGITALLNDLSNAGIRFKDLNTTSKLSRRYFCRPCERKMTGRVLAIYTFEMARIRRTLMQNVLSLVISTALYFVVFGSAIGSRITDIQGVSYGAFIMPGLIMLTLITNSIANASFGIYFPRFIGTIYEILSAPIPSTDRDGLCRRGGEHPSSSA